MKKIISFTIVICLMFCLTGCVTKGSKNYTETTGRLIAINESKDLYYDINTKIVYLLFNECTGYQGYGYMSPYYADNGKPYMYANGELVKIQ